MKEKNIPKVGEWWTIISKPRFYSSTFGDNGLDKVSYPYTFQVEEFEKSTTYNSYNIRDGKWGWVLMDETEMCFRKATKTEIPKSENEYFYTIPTTDKEVEKLTPIIRKLAEKGNFKEYKNTWTVLKNAYYVNTSNAGWGYSNIKDWGYYSKSTQLSVDEFIVKFSDRPNNMYKINRNGLSKAQCEIVNNWATEQDRLFRIENYRERGSKIYTYDTGYIFSSPRKDRKANFHVFSDIDDNNCNNDYLEVDFDYFYNHVILNLKDPIELSNPCKELPLKEETIEYDFSIPKKSTISIQSIPINLTIPTFNF